MNPRKVRLFDRIWRIVAGSRSVPSLPLTPLYRAIKPERGTRAYLFSNGSTACQITPPTFSKYTSMPFGDAAASWVGKSAARWSTAASKPSSSLTKAQFRRAAGNADGPRAGELGELADQRPDRSARRRDYHRLTGLRLADLAHAAIGSEPRHAKHA